MRLEDLLASFWRHLRAAAKAPRTIELYSQSLRRFSRWLTDRGGRPVSPAPLGGWRDPSTTQADLREAFTAAGFDWVTSHVSRETVAT